MKQLKRILCAVVLGLLVLWASACTPAEVPASKPVITGKARTIRTEDNLSKVVAHSFYVAYGTVVGKEEPMTFERDGYIDCYARVTIEVIDCAKGGWQPGDRITYWEEGGELADCVYVYPHVQTAEIGDRVFLFRGGALPTRQDLCWVVDESEIIEVRNAYLPGTVPATGEQTTPVSVAAMLEAVRTELAENPAATAQTPSGQHRRGATYGLYPRQSFSEVVELADCVVRGTVQAKGDVTQVIYDVSGSGLRSDCYREVTLEVMDCAKGAYRPGDTVIYREYGGETTEIIYTYDDWKQDTVEPGDEVLLFLVGNQRLRPETFWIIEPGQTTIRVDNDLLPDSMLPEEDSYVTEVSIAEMFDAIRVEAK